MEQCPLAQTLLQLLSTDKNTREKAEMYFEGSEICLQLISLIEELCNCEQTANIANLQLICCIQIKNMIMKSI